MKNTIAIALTVIIFGLGMCNYLQNKDRQSLKAQLYVATNNLKSEKLKTTTWIDKYNNVHSKSIEQQVSITDLKNSNDSSSIMIKNLLKQNNMLLRKLQSYASVDISVKFDTVYKVDSSVYGCHDLSNKNIYNKVCITPDSIKSSVSLSPHLDILLNKERVTIDPRKKFFLTRWFQRKQDIITAEVISNNPYLIITQQKFTKIYK